MRPVNQHRTQNQRPPHHELPVLADVHQRHAVDQDAQEHHADQGAAYLALAAHQAGAADDDRGDYVVYSLSELLRLTAPLGT